MSVLSNLEKELGLPTFDISSLQETKMDIYDGVDLSTPSKPFNSDTVREQTEDHILKRMGRPDLIGTPNKTPWLSTNDWHPEIVASSMGISITNITNLYLSVLELYRNTTSNEVKNKSEEILRGLYNNNISRDECNKLINELNQLR